MELESKSMKAQLRKADKFNPTSVLIRGENEIVYKYDCDKEFG